MGTVGYNVFERVCEKMTMYDRIKALRISRGWSQDELARRVGYSNRSTIAKIENGERDLSRSKIQTFANAFGVSPSFLMDGKTEQSSSEGLNEIFEHLSPSQKEALIAYARFLTTQSQEP